MHSLLRVNTDCVYKNALCFFVPPENEGCWNCTYLLPLQQWCEGEVVDVCKVL